MHPSLLLVVGLITFGFLCQTLVQASQQSLLLPGAKLLSGAPARIKAICNRINDNITDYPPGLSNIDSLGTEAASQPAYYLESGENVYCLPQWLGPGGFTTALGYFHNFSPSGYYSDGYYQPVNFNGTVYGCISCSLPPPKTGRYGYILDSLNPGTVCTVNWMAQEKGQDYKVSTANDFDPSLLGLYYARIFSLNAGVTIPSKDTGDAIYLLYSRTGCQIREPTVNTIDIASDKTSFTAKVGNHFTFSAKDLKTSFTENSQNQGLFVQNLAGTATAASASAPGNTNYPGADMLYPTFQTEGYSSSTGTVMYGTSDLAKLVKTWDFRPEKYFYAPTYVFLQSFLISFTPSAPSSLGPLMGKQTRNYMPSSYGPGGDAPQ